MNIGEEKKEITFEPVERPAGEPVHEPEPVLDPEPSTEPVEEPVGV